VSVLRRAATAPTGTVVSVRFLGYLRRVAGHREIEVTVDADTTVDDLLQTLARTHGEEFSRAIFRAPGEVHTYLRVFLNEEEARMTDRVAPGGSAAEMALLVVPGFEGGR
jgi:molybdopterin converting factor small subunit